MSKLYSWHQEYYDKALKELVMTTGKRCEHSPEGGCEGWLDWFEVNYPEHYKKYEDAFFVIKELWGNMDPRAMEEFKAAVKIEVDATKWAVDQFLSFRDKEEQQEEKSEQGVLL